MSEERISDDKLAWIWRHPFEVSVDETRAIARELQHRRAEPPPSPASEVESLVGRLEAIIRLEKINRQTGGYGWPPSDPTLLADLEMELKRLQRDRAAVGWQPAAQEDAGTVDILNIVPIKTKPGHLPVNLPFERLPQSADDPGFGPLPLDRENITSPVDRIEGADRAAVQNLIDAAERIADQLERVGDHRKDAPFVDDVREAIRALSPSTRAPAEDKKV
jgi:hypothetical protein